jgi:hypothetical protein
MALKSDVLTMIITSLFNSISSALSATIIRASGGSARRMPDTLAENYLGLVSISGEDEDGGPLTGV